MESLSRVLSPALLGSEFKSEKSILRSVISTCISAGFPGHGVAAIVKCVCGLHGYDKQHDRDCLRGSIYRVCFGYSVCYVYCSVRYLSRSPKGVPRNRLMTLDAVSDRWCPNYDLRCDILRSSLRRAMCC